MHLLSLLLISLLLLHPIFSLSPPTSAAAPTSSTAHPPSSAVKPTSSSTLDPKQLRALQSLHIPTTKDPCSNPHNATVCDAGKPFRHLLSLRLTNCSRDVYLSFTALKSLSSLQDLSFFNCPISPIHFPSQLSSNLRSFFAINSFKKLTGVWLSRLENLIDLTVSGVTVKASGPTIIMGRLKKIKSFTISHANLTGYLPKSWHSNITHIDLSVNQLKGSIPSSITQLENLVSLNLSSNGLTGEIPSSIGDLIVLRNLSLSLNSISGSIPHSIAAMPELIHLDLGSNQLNGTIPGFLADMKGLKYLNLEKNNFHGVMPFNGSFIKRLVVFKIGENTNLCYNHTTISSKLKLGIAPCDKYGLPMSPPAKSVSSGDSDNSDYEDSSADETSQKKKGHHGPNKVVLGIAIALSSIVFLIIFLILLSKWCA